MCIIFIIYDNYNKYGCASCWNDSVMTWQSWVGREVGKGLSPLFKDKEKYGGTVHKTTYWNPDFIIICV